MRTRIAGPNQSIRFVPYRIPSGPQPPGEVVAEAEEEDGHLQRRPASRAWLNRPAWIDGGVNPPQFYITIEEINATLRAHGYPPRSTIPEQAQPTAVEDPIALPVMPQRDTTTGVVPVALPKQTEVVLGPSVGCIVNVSLMWMAEQPSVQGKRKGATKRTSIDKVQRISVNQASTRRHFIEQCLKVINHDKIYVAGEKQGPSFKLWWKGSGGGKAKAPTIDNDNDWSNILSMMPLHKKDAEILVEFDLAKMGPFRAAESPPSDTAAAGEAGTHVPRVSQFSNEDQLHGELILKLKKTWPCPTHQGEHGNPGHCYIDPTTHIHYGLNPLRLKRWAAAMANHDYSISHPPPDLFDGGSRDVMPLGTGIKPRGRTGARFSDTGVSSDLPTIAALMFLERMSEGHRQPQDQASTPAPSRFARPQRGQELEACLSDFYRTHDIDLRDLESILAIADFTPDIIPDIPVDQLTSMLGIVEGRTRKLQKFCTEWVRSTTSL